MIKLYSINCGWLNGPTSFFLAGEPGRLRVPVPVFLIDHPKGMTLFDTGVTQRMQERVQKNAAISGFSVDLKPEGEIGARLRFMGIDPGAIRWVALSHLHLDHCAGLASIPNATLLVQRAEYGIARSEAGGPEYDPSYFDLGHPVKELDGEFDLYGDGSFVLFPSPGHTAGHQCARVRLPSGDVILTGDCCYTKRTMDELKLPSRAFDAEHHLASVLRLRELRGQGARIFYGHDPEQWVGMAETPTLVG